MERPKKEYRTRPPIDFSIPAKTPEQALESLRLSCARAERAPSDVRRSLLRWRMAPEDCEAIIESLIRDRYLDEERYAAAYVRDKLSTGGWGRIKIEQGLRAKFISREAITQALEQIQDQQQDDQLEELLRRRYDRERPRAENSYALIAKLIRWAMGRGYGYDQIRNKLNRITKEDIEEW